MPIRQKKAPPLQTPEEIAKEKKPTSTCAMGMKMTLASTECWKNQIKSEERISEEWKKTYQPDYEEIEREALLRTRQMEEMRREERESNPLRPLLLDGHSKEGKGRKLYLSERLKLDPQEKQGAPLTANQTIGWDAARFGAAAVDSPLATQRNLYHSGKSRGAPIVSSTTMAAGSIGPAAATAGGGGGAGSGGFLPPISLQNSSAVAGSMGTAASHGKAATRGGNDPLANVHSIFYDGSTGACEIVRQ